MKYYERLHPRLQERYRRLYKANLDTYATSVVHFLAWADALPAIAYQLDAVERRSFDAAKWFEEHTRPRGFNLPPDENDMASYAMWLLRRIAGDPSNGWRVATKFSNERNVNDMLHDFNEQIVEPLFDYLQDRLAAGSDLLYLLDRYRRQVGWWDLDDLHDRYLSDRAHGEEIYDAHLRRFLFEQGIDFPFSQPEGPSGRADVVAGLDSDEPLTCEVKLFNGESYGPAYLSKGLGQARRYAEDYGKREAHLVIFNLTDRSLELPTDDEDAGWPPRITVGDITVFLIVVQAGPRPPASEGGKPRLVKIARDQLVVPEGDR